jgi:hypothetical protein
MKASANTDAFCGARTRSGAPCRRRKVSGRARCRLHGGAAGSGAPLGERNGRYRTGEHTNEAKAERRWVREIVRAAKGQDSTVSDMNKLPAVQEEPRERTPRKRPKPVRAKVIVGEGNQFPVAVPIDEPPAEWAAALRDALGTSSGHFVHASLRRLMAASMEPGLISPTTNSLSASLALIQGMEPENEMQAALAVNIACLHAAVINVMSRLSNGGGDRRVIMLATAVARLERAFHSAVETYYRLKRGNTQVIRVEKLEIQPGAQAIVGNVNRA